MEEKMADDTEEQLLNMVKKLQEKQNYAEALENAKNTAALQKEDKENAGKYLPEQKAAIERFKKGEISIEEVENIIKKAQKTAGGTKVEGKLSFLQKCKQMVIEGLKHFTERHNENLTPKNIVAKPIYFTAKTTDRQ